MCVITIFSQDICLRMGVKGPTYSSELVSRVHGVHCLHEWIRILSLLNTAPQRNDISSELEAL